jgi:hypothetical protein
MSSYKITVEGYTSGLTARTVKETVAQQLNVPEDRVTVQIEDV